MNKNEVVARWLGNDVYGIIQRDNRVFRAFYSPSDIPKYENKGYKTMYSMNYETLHEAWVKFRDLKFDDEDQRELFWEYRKRIEWAITRKPITEAFDELVKGIEWYNSLNKTYGHE